MTKQESSKSNDELCSKLTQSSTCAQITTNHQKKKCDKYRARGKNGELRNSQNIETERYKYKLIAYKFLFLRQRTRKEYLKYYLRWGS